MIVDINLELFTGMTDPFVDSFSGSVIKKHDSNTMQGRLVESSGGILKDAVRG